jgi:hypothetical protein
MVFREAKLLLRLLIPPFKGNLRLRHPIRRVASSDAPEGADRRTLRVLSPMTPFPFFIVKEGARGNVVPPKIEII